MLSPDDLVTVLTALLDVSADWYNIGLALGLTPGTLDAIKAPGKEHKDCLRDMLNTWLRSSSLNCSWEGLRQALRSPIVGQGWLADRLEASSIQRESGSLEGMYL